MNPIDIRIIDYRPEYGLETVKMWRRSFQRAMGLEEQDDFANLREQLDYFATIDPAAIRVAIRLDDSSIVGMMVLRGSTLEHLYVDVACQGLGLGSEFMQEAKVKSPLGIELYTFQRNRAAQRFYLSRGFREIERGFADPASNPWARERTDLADILYRWSPRGAVSLLMA